MAPLPEAAHHGSAAVVVPHRSRTHGRSAEDGNHGKGWKRQSTAPAAAQLKGSPQPSLHSHSLVVCSLLRFFALVHLCPLGSQHGRRPSRPRRHPRPSAGERREEPWTPLTDCRRVTSQPFARLFHLTPASLLVILILLARSTPSCMSRASMAWESSRPQETRSESAEQRARPARQSCCDESTLTHAIVPTFSIILLRCFDLLALRISCRASCRPLGALARSEARKGQAGSWQRDLSPA